MKPEQVLERYTKVAPGYDRVVTLSAKLTFCPLERYRKAPQGVERMTDKMVAELESNDPAKAKLTITQIFKMGP